MQKGTDFVTQNYLKLQPTLSDDVIEKTALQNGLLLCCAFRFLRTRMSLIMQTSGQHLDCLNSSGPSSLSVLPENKMGLNAI